MRWPGFEGLGIGFFIVCLIEKKGDFDIQFCEFCK